MRRVLCITLSIRRPPTSLPVLVRSALRRRDQARVRRTRAFADGGKALSLCRVQKILFLLKCVQIQIGESSNFQDLSIGHADPGFPLIIGDRVTVGHRCITHGCEIQDDCLIGMGSVLMNGVKISRGCIVGAGAIILEGTQVPPFSMIAGSPAKVLKKYDKNIIENIEKISKHYVKLAEKYLNRFVTG